MKESEQDDICNYLSSGFKAKHPLDTFVSRIVNRILMDYLTPWLVECLEKYSNEDFHQKMAANFDFIADWKLNHPRRYSMFIKGGRRFRNRIDFDKAAILERVVKILMNNGWTVYPEEVFKLGKTIRTVMQEIDSPYGVAGDNMGDDFPNIY